MLFDLRSRGRRTSVRIIYLFLALVMAGGLVLVGVGTGSNQGGLLNAFTNNGTGGGGSQFADQTLHKAIKAAQKNPSAANWASLLQARWSDANSGGNLNSTTGVYSASGKKQLQQGTVAWQHYLKATKDKPTLDNAFLAAGVYQNLGQWSGAATAWEYAAATQPAGSATSLKPYLCLALSSYAAKQTSKGDLAAAEAVKLTPKLQRLTLSSTFKQAKSSPTTAQQNLIADC